MNCPICGNTSVVLLERSRQLGSVHMNSDSTMDLLVEGCRHCDFVWNANAFAHLREFESWMASAYRSYQLLSNDLHEFPLVDARSEMAREFLDRYCDWPQIRHVLEVGSNRGDFLAYLQSCYSHLQLLGVESSPLSLVGIPTIFNDVREIRFSASFDLVVIRQVLEHMLEPIALLRHLSSFVREGGWLLVEVPDLENDLDEGVDPWVMEHVGHFSEKSLARLAGLAGLSLVGIDRGYQLMALFTKGSHGTQSLNTASHGRWTRVQPFLDRVAESQKEWHELVRQGYELCFYGASNVFLAISGVLQECWQEDWNNCSKSLVDDYAQKHSTLVGGINVQSWDDFSPKANCIYIVCSMYRFHRRKMIPKVLDRLRPEDRVFAMWTPHCH